MQLTIGSNRLRNTDGVVSVRGNRQIMLEWGPLDSELWLTMDLYNAGGTHIARLRRNQWTFNDRQRFDFSVEGTGFNLVDTKSSQLVLEARVVGRDSVLITRGAFYSSAGDHIEITVEDWNGGGITSSPTATEPGTQTTNPPFSADEIASIRKAVASSSETIQCPQCGCPLARERVSGADQVDTELVSCIVCKRHIVIRSQS
jgi:hypothetical protein